MNIFRVITFPLRFLIKPTFFLVGLALVLGVGGAVGGYRWLRTDEGQLWAGREAGDAATRFLQGRFVIQRIRFGFHDGLVLHGVKIDTDTGAEVATFDRFRFDWLWLPLLSRKLVVQEILLETPRVAWSPEASEVFTLRNPKPPEPETTTKEPFRIPIDVVVNSLRIFELQGSFEQTGFPSRAVLAPLTLQAEGSLLRRDAIAPAPLGHVLLDYALTLRAQGAGHVSAKGHLSFAENFEALLTASGELEALEFQPLRTVSTKEVPNAPKELLAALTLTSNYAWSAGETWPALRVPSLLLRTAAGNVEGDASIEPNRHFELRLESSRLNMTQIPWSALRPGLNITGDISFRAIGKGLPSRPDVALRLGACNILVSLPALPLSLRGRRSCLEAVGTVTHALAFVDVQGQAFGVPLHLRTQAEGNAFAKETNPLGIPLEATLETGPLPVGVLAELAATPALRDVQGVLDASVRVTGTARAPRVLWNISADRLSYRQWRNVDAFFSGESLPSGTHAELSLFRDGGRMATFAARVVPPVDAAKTLPLQGLPLSERELLASHLEVDIDVPGLVLPGIAERSVEGYLQASYENAGATVVSSFLLLEERSSVGAINMSVAADLKALLSNSQEAFADVKATWKGAIAKGSLEADIPDLATLKPIVESFGAPLESLSGKAMVRASLQGPLAKPFLGGRVLLEDVSYVPESGASIEDVSLDLIVTEDRIDIRNVSLNRGGVVRGSGGITGLFPFEPKFTFEASTNDLRLLPLIFASPTLDARVALEGSLDDAGVLRSRVTINELRAYVPILQATKGRRAQALDAHPDVSLEQNGKPFTQPGRPSKKTGGSEGEPARKQAKDANASSLLNEAHVDVSTPNRTWVQGPDIQLELGTDMRVDWVDGIVSLEGQAGVVRPGFVQVLGKRFDVNAAQVVYANEDPARGTLEAEATHVTDVATVFIDVTGPVAKPELVLRSEPELSQFEIASLIVTGKTTENFAAEQEGQEGEASTQDKAAAVAANAIANTLATQVLGAFARNTDVVLSIDFEDAKNRKAKVGVGRYVTDKLFVSLDRNFGSEEQGGNGNEVRFDYRLSRRWSVEGNYGDGREGGVDLLWKRKF